MPRATFRQADVERLIKAAAKTNSMLRVDLKTLVVSILPLSAMTDAERRSAIGGFIGDGKENWDDIPSAKLPDDFAF